MGLFTINQIPPGPASGAYAITPSDTQRLPFDTRGLYVGVTGNVTVVMANDVLANTVLFTAVPAGSLLPISVAYVLSSGTTASSLVGVY